MLEFVTFLLIISGTVMLFLCILALQRRTVVVSYYFAGASICAAIWDFGFAAEILSRSLAAKIFWANIQFLGITFLPLVWLGIAMFITGQPRQNLKVIPYLAIIPLIVNLSIWLDPIHHLFRLNPVLITEGVPFPVLVNDYGPLFFAVHVPFGYFLFAASVVLLLRSWKKTPAIYKRQRLILLISVVIPLSVDILYVFGISPIPSFNFTSIFFSISGLLMSISVVSFRVLDMLPLAYEAAVNEMKVGVVVLDASGLISHLNPAAEKITGLVNDQNLGREAREVLPQLDPLWNSEDDHIDMTTGLGEEEKDYQIVCTNIAGGKGRTVGKVITINDITDQVRLYKKVEELSITDPLTGALNRRALKTSGEKLIHSAVRYRHELSMVMLDVDDFKGINDRYGHQAGDDILTAMVGIIREKIRENDLVFRYGGDEFILLLCESGPEKAVATAERIQMEISSLKAGGAGDDRSQVAVSMGIANLKEQDDIESMLHRADRALYRAKADGKGRIVV